MKILIFSLLLLFSSNIYSKIDPKTYIPPQAIQYIPIIKEETKLVFPKFPYVFYFGALIEHESCITLTHKKCWNPSSQLKTKRELGVGLGQLTKAYRDDGSVRFDTLSDLVKNNNRYLKELTWNNIIDRPDLQIRAIIILYKDSYDNIALIKVPGVQRLAMADSAYNGGIRDVIRSRTVCGLSKDCDPNIWFNNVENYNVKSKKILYGNRSARDINNHHVRDVIFVRTHKYIFAFRNN